MGNSRPWLRSARSQTHGRAPALGGPPAAVAIDRAPQGVPLIDGSFARDDIDIRDPGRNQAGLGTVDRRGFQTTLARRREPGDGTGLGGELASVDGVVEAVVAIPEGPQTAGRGRQGRAVGRRAALRDGQCVRPPRAVKDPNLDALRLLGMVFPSEHHIGARDLCRRHERVAAGRGEDLNRPPETLIQPPAGDHPAAPALALPKRPARALSRRQEEGLVVDADSGGELLRRRAAGVVESRRVDALMVEMVSVPNVGDRARGVEIENALMRQTVVVDVDDHLVGQVLGRKMLGDHGERQS